MRSFYRVWSRPQAYSPGLLGRLWCVAPVFWRPVMAESFTCPTRAGKINVADQAAGKTLKGPDDKPRAVQVNKGSNRRWALSLASICGLLLVGQSRAARIRGPALPVTELNSPVWDQVWSPFPDGLTIHLYWPFPS
jgi:hypothetical protein